MSMVFHSSLKGKPVSYSVYAIIMTNGQDKKEADSISYQEKSRRSVVPVH